MLRIPRQTASDDPGTTSSSATPSSSAAASDSSNAVSPTPSGTSSAPSSASSDPPTSIPTSLPTLIPPTTAPNVNTTISQSVAPSSSSNSLITDSPPPPPVGTQSPAPGNADNSSPLFLSPNSTTIPAANLTTIVTMVNGQSTTFTSVLPTNLATGSANSSAGNNRTAIIAGTTAAAGFLLICALVIVFIVRKVQLRKAIADALKDKGAKREGRGLLEDEGFDDDNSNPHMRSAYSTYSTVGAGARAASTARSGSPVPSHIKSRTSESGSIFREEVWPPPGFVDPISKQSSEVDLSRIVDEVMGPKTAVPPSASSGSAIIGGGHTRGPTNATTLSGHTTSYSHSSIDSRAGLVSAPAASHSDPFASSSNQGSVYYPASHIPIAGTMAPSQLPPGALPPAMPGLSTPGASTSSPTASSAQNPAVPHAATQPKKSSPLARALSKDARIFMGGRP